MRRLAATAQLAAQEYGLGVVDGRVVAPAEVEEARLFLEEAKRSRGQLPPEWSVAATKEIDAVLVLVARHAAASEVTSRVRRLTTTLSTGLGVSLDERTGRESIARAWRRGVTRRSARSVMAASAGAMVPPRPGWIRCRPISPMPPRCTRRSPLDFYRRITIGVVGTAMPSFEATLSAEDRWAVASYASLLRLPAAQGDVPASLTAFGTTARLSDSALGEALAGTAQRCVGRWRAWRRCAATSRSGRASRRPRLHQVRTQIDEALQLASEGTSPTTRAPGRSMPT